MSVERRTSIRHVGPRNREWVPALGSALGRARSGQARWPLRGFVGGQAILGALRRPWPGSRPVAAHHEVRQQSCNISRLPLLGSLQPTLNSVQEQSRSQMLSVLPCLYLPLSAHHRQGRCLIPAAVQAYDAFDESLTA